MQLHTGDPYDRDSEVFQRHVRELEYQALLDVALENAALGVDSILCAPFGRECKTLESYTSFILFEARKPGHFRSGIHVAYCIVMQNAI